MKIYIDSECRCHTTNPDGIFQEVNNSFFEGKCQKFIEGYCYEPDEEKFYPCKTSSELAAAQEQYELMMAEAAAAYREGVNSID